MPGTSNFQQWNPNQTNQESDASYTSDTLRSGGAANPSIFPSSTANKLFYQLSTFVTAFAGMLAAKNYSVSDSSLATLQTVLANVMTLADMSPYAPLASPTFTGTPTATTPSAADNSTRLATTAWATTNYYVRSYIDTALAALAPLASPALTGTPTAPTQATGDNSTRLATTAFVKAQNYQAALGFTPVQQGGGANQSSVNKLFLGWDGLSVRAQVDAIDLGGLALLNGFAASALNNGYQKLPSGLLIQWGSGVVPGSGSYSFPIPFPDHAFVMISNDIGAGPGSGVHVTSCVITSASGFNAYAIDNTGAYVTTNVGWVAIGK